MSSLQEYRHLQHTIRELTDRMNSLSNDTKLKQEIEFEEKVRALMAQYNKSLKDVVSILDPDNKLSQGSKSSKATGGIKRARKVKQYKNPKTGEVIETKGGNHKELKAWKEKYGADTVESWVTILG
ncbi:histone-like nucleoid-structuring protein MvaT [Halopseudomonas pelagia]|uniref:histone-like nucleoid-structuring protein MvaT n=1 Tax=Halopseudomonas pelagia TaxID=553151 RepID=UPI00039FC8CD|nr:histone-like nucleoid-structuring protein MvaT [Halopseudomonas pelagia]|tara:strand:+ start:241 stop:618 length:378 start_codon:yes stop_codon:yes gene_type:complete